MGYSHPLMDVHGFASQGRARPMYLDSELSSGYSVVRLGTDGILICLVHSQTKPERAYMVNMSNMNVRQWSNVDSRKSRGGRDSEYVSPDIFSGHLLR